MGATSSSSSRHTSGTSAEVEGAMFNSGRSCFSTFVEGLGTGPPRSRAAMLGTGSSIFVHVDGFGGGGCGFLGGVGVKTPAVTAFAGGVVRQGLGGDILGGGDAPFTANCLPITGPLSLLDFLSG